MTQLPRVTVAPREDGCWVATCDRCDFVFWHVRRYVTDEQAVRHRNTGHRKGNRWT